MTSGNMLVPPIGPKNACIALVGEAPGEMEVRFGKPFVGASGSLLDECLQNAAISRTGCYITNVVKERPQDNNIKHFVNLEKGTQTEKFNVYVQALKDELEHTSANVIVAVGAVALYTLTGQRHIMKWHGSIMESTLLPGRKVIPIIHPAAALREYILKYMIIHDLKRVKEESTTPEIILPQYNMILNPSFEQTMELLDGIFTAKGPVAFDIEVVGKELECFAFATSSRDAFCIVIYDKGERFTLEQEAKIMLKVGEILEHPDIPIILQNGAFDCSYMRTKYGICTTNTHDTMIATGLLTPDFPKGLDFLCANYTRQPYYKDDGKMYHRGSVDDSENFWRYNALDALVTYECYDALMRDLAKMDMLNTYNATAALIPILVEMQHVGILMDREALAKESVILDARIKELNDNLEKVAGMPLNANSPKQLQNYFYVNKRIKPYVKQGRPTVDEKALIRIGAKGYIEAKIILAIRKAIKMKSTYIDMTFDNDNRLRCSYNPIGTVTGRLSSAANIITGTGGNMQNLPHSYYRFMLVDEGYVVYNVDLAGAENRIVANCGPVPSMKKAFDLGMDVHCLTAGQMFNIPTDDPRLREPAPIGDGLKTYRDWGKRMNHSSNYGIGPDLLARVLEIEVSEARKLLDLYHNAYPEVRNGYQAQIINMLRNGRIVTNPMGRKRLFLDRWGNDLFMAAFGHFAQSTVADIINSRGFPVLWNDSNVVILNQVHDSLVFQIPIAAGWEVHRAVICKLLDKLAEPLTWKSVTFSIPAEAKMLVGNFANGAVITPASNFHEVYETLESKFKVN